MLFMRFGIMMSHFEGVCHVAEQSHAPHRESLHLPCHLETRVPGNSLWWGWGRHLRLVLDSDAWALVLQAQLKTGGEVLSQLSWGALLGRLSGPSTVCYYFYKGGSVCWIMFGQLLAHSCGWGWVGTWLLYLETVDLCAAESREGMQRKQVGEADLS